MTADSQTTGPSTAGEFESWRSTTEAALIARSGVDVPCGNCNACCKSAQFILVGPDDTSARAVISPDLLFDAPGRPGHQIMGFNESGHCPMLIDDACSIYHDRPQACRSYDCRLFAATGITPDQPAIAAQTLRWRFQYADASARRRHVAVAEAAQWLQQHCPGEAEHPVQWALSALRVHALFVPLPAQRDADLANQVRAILAP